MTTGVNNYNYNDYFYNNQYSNYTGATSGLNNAYYDSSILTTDTTTTSSKKAEKDDGKIGFFKALKNLGKGAVKFFTGMFTDSNGNFSIGQTLKTAAIAVGVGAVTVLTAGTAVPAMIAAAGIGISALGMGKSVVNILTADTDAEAEAAWESLGSNTTAAGLALVGAKAISKSGAAAEEAAQFDGIAGYGKAAKHVFKTSKDSIAENFKGVKAAYKEGADFKGSVSNVKTTVKSNITEKYSDFKGTVKTNYEKTVYGTKGKIAEEAESANKELEQVKIELQRVKPDTKAHKALTTKKTKLEAKNEAIKNINSKDNWETANEQILKDTRSLKELQSKLASATEEEAKTNLNTQISKLETQIKYEKEILNRRTVEAQHIKKQINDRNKKIEALEKEAKENASVDNSAKIANLENEISSLKAKQDFKLPKITEDQAEQIKAYEAALKSKGETTTQSNNPVPKTISEEEYTSLKHLRKIQNGKGSTFAASEIGRVAVKDPIAKWLTIGVAGKQFGNANQEAQFYSLLTAEEKVYFKSLSDDQKAAIIATYNQYLAT